MFLAESWKQMHFAEKVEEGWLHTRLNLEGYFWTHGFMNVSSVLSLYCMYNQVLIMVIWRQRKADLYTTYSISNAYCMQSLYNLTHMPALTKASYPVWTPDLSASWLRAIVSPFLVCENLIGSATGHRKSICFSFVGSKDCSRSMESMKV